MPRSKAAEAFGGIMGIIVIGMLSSIVILLLLAGLIASIKLLMGVVG